MIYARPFTRSGEPNHDYMTVVDRIFEFGFHRDYNNGSSPKWYFIVSHGNVVRINTGTDWHDRVVSVYKDNDRIAGQVHYHGDVFYLFYSMVRLLKFDNITAFLNAFDYVMDEEQHKVFEQLYMLELL